MKKLLTLFGIIIFLFLLIFLIQDRGDKKDKLYQNQISSEELEKLVNSNKPSYVYFYQTDCIYCKEVSPVIIPMAKEMGIELKEHNLQENPDNWEKYGIEGTPTIILFEDKKEVKRIVGAQENKVFEDWFKER